MSDYNEKIAQLQQRLDRMVEYQGYFNREIAQLKNEIYLLKQRTQQFQQNPQPQIQQQVTPQYQPPQVKAEPIPNTPKTEQTQVLPSYQATNNISQNLHIEEFVGKNLISIIGIIITIIGVGIGAKYAIDRNLISPAMRILLGYIFAFGLLGFAFKTKTNYERFSAVLLSGAAAILYFLTFFAYSFYDLFPQSFAFLLMVTITVFTVLSAIKYNRQIIAVIGLVGAFAVPFLLSNNSGKVEILFAYISIINLGILTVSILKYWRVLYFSAFGLTWLIFLAWFIDKYKFDEHFTLAMFFATIFFAIFYVSFIFYKLRHQQEFSIGNKVLLLANSFIYFGLGYLILDGRLHTAEFLGFFTIANAIIHFAVSFIISQRIKTPQTLYFTMSLALFFVTFAVPIQLKGIWTPIFWTIEAVFLFWVGLAKRINFYEIASYILMILAGFAVFVYLGEHQVNWYGNYYATKPDEILTLMPFYNKPFLVGAIFAFGFGIICYLANFKNFVSYFKEDLLKVLKVVVSSVFLIALYNVFRTEIGNYWHLQYVKTAIYGDKSNFNQDLSLFNIVWQINYTMLFMTILSFINLKRLKNTVLGFTNLTLNGFVLSIFAVIGLFFISELRESYLNQSQGIFPTTFWHIAIRYISFAFAVALIYVSYRLYKSEFLQKVADIMLIFEMVFAGIMLIFLSSELLNLMDIFGYNDSYKLALSLLWGSYSLILIGLGIWKRKTHLRIGAIILFAFTLVKVFFYDIATLSTISKTIVFVSLGVMLLIISFLYNKYKNLLFDDNENQQS